MYQKCQFESVKINASLLMSREWAFHPLHLAWYHANKLHMLCVFSENRVAACFVNILSIWWAVNSCFCIFSFSTKEMLTLVLLVTNLHCIDFKHWWKVFFRSSRNFFHKTKEIIEMLGSDTKKGSFAILAMFSRTSPKKISKDKRDYRDVGFRH